MNETEWLQGRDPHALYTFVLEATTLWKTRWQGWVGARRFRVSQRKEQLFLVACCRRIQHLAPEPEGERVLDLLERLADGLATEEELQAACTVLRMAEADRRNNQAGTWFTEYIEATNAILAAGQTGRRWEEVIDTAAAAWGYSVAGQYSFGEYEEYEREEEEEAARQADLLRDILGNPFQSPYLDPAWLAWQDRLAVRLAEGIYQERTFEHLPILGDALEEAGCTQALILDHCRQPGPHTRGCWVVDLVLNRDREE
jgi:hypothetical protein